MPETQVMHRCKKVDSPTSLEELRFNGGHGDSVWIENGDGSRHLHLFDRHDGVIRTPKEFAAAQKPRAKEKRRLKRERKGDAWRLKYRWACM